MGVERLEYLWKDEVVGVIYVDFEQQVVKGYEYLSELPWFNVFSDGKVSYQALSDFCSRRVLPECRYIRDYKLQQAVGYIKYDPIKLCHFTNGARATDMCWLRFPDKAHLKYDDVKLYLNPPVVSSGSQ